VKNAPKNGAKKQPIFSTLKPDKKLCKTNNYAKTFNPKKMVFFGAKTPKNSENRGLPKSLIDTVHPKLD
jgi:hypothetical protein